MKTAFMNDFQVYLEGGAPWGFRLHGGKEFRAPLRVAKVIDGGKAHGAGIQVGDQVLEINGKNVEMLYHTEALVAVKKATDSLQLKLKRDSQGCEDSRAIQPGSFTQADSADKMIQVKSFNPTSSVPMKPASATSVPLDQTLYDSTYKPLDERTYEDFQNDVTVTSEWSPHLINEVVRTPDPISISKDADDRRSESMMDNNYDPLKIRKKTPQAPLSPLGFDKAKPTGRGRRRLTSSGSSSFDIKDFKDRQGLQDSGVKLQDRDQASTSPQQIQFNNNMTRTSSLPRSVGKKIKQGMEQKSMTLPRKTSQKTPVWYKDMYKEIHKTMEGQSHLSRLLTADAARGAFRDYDGATSPRSRSPNDENRKKQRPKSIHVDHFTFPDVEVQSASKTTNGSSQLSAAVRRSLDTNAEKREKRHSVHSLRYRDFQRGGNIPAAGLSGGSEENMKMQFSVPPSHTRSRSQDDMLSAKFQGLPYQRSDDKLHGLQTRDPIKFEYNNPPDFLELRRKAEAEGTLREEREREIKMLQEERRKWLEEEEQLRKSNANNIGSNEKLDLERQRRVSEEKRREKIELQRQQQQREDEMRRADEVQKRREELEKEEEARLASQIDTTSEKLSARAIALYSFVPQSPLEIGFKKGDVLDLIRQIDENWYEGELNGQLGIFPVSYVEVIEEEAEPEPGLLLADDQAEVIQIEEGSAKARYSFRAENENELSFKKNDMITLLRQIDSNWYEGEIADRIGIFPSAYIEVLKSPRIIGGESAFSEQDPDNVQHDIVPDAIKSRQNGKAYDCIEEPVKPVFDEHYLPEGNDSTVLLDSNELYESSAYPSMKAADQTIKAPTEHRGPTGERHQVVFSYNSLNEDEVDLKEGDIVYVLEKCDDGWFVGTCERSGMFGIFPGNYVVPS